MKHPSDFVRAIQRARDPFRVQAIHTLALGTLRTVPGINKVERAALKRLAEFEAELRGVMAAAAR